MNKKWKKFIFQLLPRFFLTVALNWLLWSAECQEEDARYSLATIGNIIGNNQEGKRSTESERDWEILLLKNTFSFTPGRQWLSLVMTSELRKDLNLTSTGKAHYYQSAHGFPPDGFRVSYNLCWITVEHDLVSHLIASLFWLFVLSKNISRYPTL